VDELSSFNLGLAVCELSAAGLDLEKNGPSAADLTLADRVRPDSYLGRGDVDDAVGLWLGRR
jgi:hypothetical protein